MDIKEIVLKIGLQVFEEHPYDEGHVVSPSGYTWIDDKLIEFAEAIIESYKEGLLNEVGEPVATLFQHKDTGRETTVQPHAASDFAKMNKRWLNCGDLYSARQVAAAIAKATKLLEEEVKAANSECELFRKNGRIVDANKIVELRTQLAAAQEQQQTTFLQLSHALRIAEDQLAEIQTQNEPVAWKYKKYSGGVYVSEHRWDKDQNLYDEEPLFAFPPSVEAIENKVAEACALQVAAETKFHWLDVARVAKEIRSGEWRKFVKEK